MSSSEHSAAGDPETSTVQKIQDAINSSHPFGLKIWKPALYPKHRSIDARTYDAVHSIPGSVTSMTIGTRICNMIWAMTFGLILAAVYLALALFLCPIYFLGALGQTIFKGSFFESVFRDLASTVDYIRLLMKLAGYLFYPFGKFVSKKKTSISTLFQAVNSPTFGENEPLLSEDEGHESIFVHDDISLSRPSKIGSSRPRNRQRTGTGTGTDDIWSEYSMQLGHGYIPSFVQKFIQESKDRGFTGAIFFILTLFVLAPIHLVISILCSLFIFPIPMAKLNYFLIRHLLRHPLLLSAHPAMHFKPQTFTGPARDTDLDAESVGPSTPVIPQVRPTSIYYWDTGNEIYGDPISPSPQVHPDPRFSGHTFVHRDYQIVLCTYRAAGLEFAKYTVDGVNIIFINMLSLIVFTLVNFYYIGPSNGYHGIANKGIIFVSSILSTIPLAYFIGMAVSSVTALTGSVAIGSVINATFGSIIEIILYIMALLEGKNELVEGAMIGSFLLGLLALPGVSMFFGGLTRKEQRFNAKSAGVTSTMLLIATIGVFIPTLFQSIYGTSEVSCLDCNSSPLAMTRPDLSCRECRITAAHPTRDPIYQSSTRPLMYFCASTLILTYAIGLWFTLNTHAKRIYPKKTKRNKRKAPELFASPLVGPNVSSGVRKRQLQFSGLPRPLSEGSALRPQLIPTCSAEPRPSATEPSSAGVQSAFSDAQSSAGSEEGNGHDDPGWGLVKSASILLTCTVAYSLIAEILIDTLDQVISLFPSISERTLGLTLFAIVPTVTEFYNAISFATSGNIVLSLEIGSAYAIQVALVQIPVLVGFSAFSRLLVDPNSAHHSEEFILVFPQLDFFSVLFSVLLLNYVYLEGKSNYFKGAILLLSYSILIAAFCLAPSH